MGTNFREHLAEARQRSWLWITLYFVFVILLAAGAGLFVGIFMWMYLAGTIQGAAGSVDATVFGTAAVVCLIVVGASVSKIYALRRGGGAKIATDMGGRPLALRSTVREERRLRRVVEEIAVAAGSPAPRVYLLTREAGINAFAAGSRRSDAVIGFTYGAMVALNREELEGVAGHEMAHVINGDMELNLTVTGALHGFIALSVLGASIAESSHDPDEPNPVTALLGILLMVAGATGAACAGILQVLANRQREYMADAASVSLTRNPLGFANALKKIGGYAKGSGMRTGHRLSYAHGFFVNPFPVWHQGLLSTHPPLEDRILRLDPHFDGTYPNVEQVRLPVPARVAAQRAAREKEREAAGTYDKSLPALAQPVAFAAVASAAADRAAIHRLRHGGRPKVPSPYKMRARPNRAHLDYARELIARIPEDLHEELHTIPGARLLVLALLADPVANKRAAQFTDLFETSDADLLAQMHDRIEALGSELRLPLLDLAIPTLRHMDTESYRDLSIEMERLIAHDETTQLREWALSRVVRHHLAPLFGLAAPSRVRYYSLAGVRKACLTLVSGLAYAGHDDAEAVGLAFEHAVAYLGLSRPKIVGPLDCVVADLDRALDAVQQVGKAHRHTLLVALAAAVSSDGLVTPDEAELFRAIADCLDHPMPPLLPGQPLL